MTDNADPFFSVMFFLIVCLLAIAFWPDDL
jgi:hypothetical protein